MGFTQGMERFFNIHKLICVTHIMCYHLYVKSKNITQMNLITKQTYFNNKLIVTKRGRIS